MSDARNSLKMRQTRAQDMEGYDDLMNGIIFQACKDYVIFHNSKDTYRLKEVENFFHSPWFRQLCNIDGDYLMQRLDKECINTGRRFHWKG